tara:strand:- start:342 stop:698 length:357 start_codon:yes stop_codon:yes gene_type:complete
MKTYKDLVNEALSPQQRMKRSIVARRTSRMRNVTRGRKKMRRKTEQELHTKSRKAARKSMIQRYARGIKWETLPFAARQQFEMMADKRRTAIQKMTLRMMPFIRKGEDERLRKAQKRR